MATHGYNRSTVVYGLLFSDKNWGKVEINEGETEINEGEIEINEGKISVKLGIMLSW